MLFISMEELISRKIGTKDILRNILFADYLALIAEREADLTRITDIMQLYVQQTRTEGTFVKRHR